MLERENERLAGSSAKAATESPVLELRNLSVSYSAAGGRIEAVQQVSLAIRRGETLGLVGESGCGKSTLAFAIMRYLGPRGAVSGEILLNGEDLRGKSDAELQRLRGARVAMVYQDPLSSLNPAIRVGQQVAEVYQVHQGSSEKVALARAVEMFAKVGLPDPDGIAGRYPHQLSGGMQQRVVIAMALCCDPDLLIMDEPTTALDVSVQARVLDLINDLRREFASAILYISHNLGVVAQVCDRVAVMYAGQVVEEGAVGDLFSRPLHPYAVGLLGCVPTLGDGKGVRSIRPIPGSLPGSRQRVEGCTFEPRCGIAREACRHRAPDLLAVGDGRKSRCHFWGEVTDLTQNGTANGISVSEKNGTPSTQDGAVPVRAAPLARSEPGRDDEPLLAATDASKYFPVAEGLSGIARRVRRLARPAVRAVDGVSIQLEAGQTLALVGESGCGKTTLARMIAGLVEPTGGSVSFSGQRLGGKAERRPAEVRRHIQMVFQNPESSLNPRQTVGAALERPLRLFRKLQGKMARREAIALLRAVNLDASYLDRYPAQLSGGEKQRVAIARAFAGEPRLVICDEPVSALDVSVQATVLNNLVDLQKRLGTSYVFVSHDLSVVRYVADWVGVIYLGQLCELGPAEQVFGGPHHPYSEALLSSVPTVESESRPERIRLGGTVPSATNVPSGCRFHTRCPRRLGDICDTVVPPVQRDGRHEIVCHIAIEDLSRLQEAPPPPRHAHEGGPSPATTLLLAIVQDNDVPSLLPALAEGGYRVTRMNAAGAPPLAGSVVMLGLVDEQLGGALRIVSETCHSRQADGPLRAGAEAADMLTGGALEFQLPVERHVRLTGRRLHPGRTTERRLGTQGPVKRGPQTDSPTRLLVAVLQEQDAADAIDALVARGYRATRIDTVGGFLRRKNVTVLVGVGEDQVDDATKTINDNCEARVLDRLSGDGYVGVGAGNVFVVRVDSFVRV